MKKINFNRYNLSVFVVTILIITLSITLFMDSFVNLQSSFKAIFNSLKYFCNIIFGVSLNIDITSITVTPTLPNINLPTNFTSFKTSVVGYCNNLINKSNLSSYGLILASILQVIITTTLLLIPAIFLLKLLLKRYFNISNTNHNQDTLPLKTFKKFVIWYPFCKQAIIEFIAYLKTNKTITKLWLLIVLLALRVFNAIIVFFAGYLYVISSGDFSVAYTTLYKIVLDFVYIIKTVPVVFWIVLIIVMFVKIRKKIALSILRHNEMKNRGYINSLPITSMLIGTMGSKKTTTLTDMTLSQTVMFRDKAYELLLLNDLKLPSFPWINLELKLQQAIKDRTVYNLVTCSKFIDNYKIYLKAIIRYNKKHKTQHSLSPALFNYDYEKYGITYNDNLKLNNIWDILTTYSKLYFIYFIQSSLLLSNYAIRTDSTINTVGNFPLWHTDFFDSNPTTPKGSTLSHVLNFDFLRLGKKIIQKNKYTNGFEFGVIAITEVGKERGNQIENRPFKKSDELANPLNDGFNKALKMIRHSATVDNFPFVKIFMDEQRAESLGADARDLCSIISIKHTSEQKLALPFFFVEEIVYSLVFNKFKAFYKNSRFLRGDNTLLGFVTKKLATALHTHYIRTYNNYGYCVATLVNDETELKEYYLSNKKIYANRFATDAFSDFFDKKTLTSPIGLLTYPKYKTSKASLEELNKQASYFITEINTNIDN